jgi:DNA repair exonuclease SbcCD ATPase subunit
MRINFSHLSIQDFMSFAKQEIDFDSDGMVLVQGLVRGESQDSNGAGKSALFEALAWVLFGETVRNVAAAKVMRQGGKEVRVILTFHVGETGPYVVTRWRTGKKVGVTLSLCPDDIPGSTSEIDVKIVQLLGFTFDMFKNSVYYGQGLPYRFIQATDAEKKALVEDMLSLEWIGVGHNRTAEVVKTYEAMDAQLGTKGEDLRNQQEGLAHLIETYQEGADSMRARIEEYRKEDEARAQEQKVEAERKKVDLERRLAGADELVEHLSQHIESFDGKIETEEARRDSWQGVADGRRREAEVTKKEAVSLKGLSKCPVCQRNVTSDLRQTLLRQAREVYEGIMSDVQSALTTAEEARNEARALRIQRDVKAEEFEKAHDVAAELRAALTIALSEVLYHHVDLTPFQAEVRKYEMMIAAAKEQRIGLGKEYDGTLELRVSVKKVLKALEFWATGFSNRGLKAFVLSAIIPFLNDRAAYYSSYLTDGQVQITFSVETAYDRFVVLVSNMESLVEYSQFSGGERRRVDVIVLLSLCDLIATRSGVDVNIRIFDEVCENLDQVGIDKLMGLFQELASERCIYVVSHNSDFEHHFSKFLQVTKDRRGISSVQEVLA